MPNHSSANDARSDHQPESLAQDSDDMLMARICDGDRAALGTLFRRYARSVRGVGYKILRDSSEADDLVQDVFVLIERMCAKFDRSRGTVRFWILMMTHARAITRRRYLTFRHFYTYLDWEKEVDRSSYALATSPRYANALGDAVEKMDTLRSGFEELSDSQRETLVLFFFEGYSFEEIAAKLGQTIGNARNHYYRGLERLRRKMLSENTLEVRRA